MLDIFRTDAFSLTTLSDAFIKAPYVPGQIGRMGLFRSKGIRTTTAVIEWKDGQLALIPTSPRGGPATQLANMKRTAETFLVPHLEKDATIYADEVQNVRAFGSEDNAVAVSAIVDEKLAELRADHEVTLEHMRASAIQGIVKDSDGSTLVQLFTKFDVVQQTSALLADAGADTGNTFRASLQDAQRLSEADLGNAPITGWTVICGKDFFVDAQKDLGVTQSIRYQDANRLLNSQRVEAIGGARAFDFGGVRFVEYVGSTGGTAFFADGEGYLVPSGPDIFRTYFAPADFVETVNTLGMPGYAKIVSDSELNRWVRVHTQSNPLVICLRPRAIIKLSVTVA